MPEEIVAREKEAMLSNYCFKCRAGNVLRKGSFVRDTFTLESLQTWVSTVHNIPRESLSLDYRDENNAWVPLKNAADLNAAIAPVDEGHAESIFTRAAPVSLGWDGSPPVVESSSPPPDPAIFESAMLVSTSAPLSEFQVAEDCHKCKASFGYLFSRRHHCRACLRSFCDACCNEYYPIEGNPTPVRHCVDCAGPAAEAQAAAEAKAGELAQLEVDIAAAVDGEDFTDAASLKARRDELNAAL